MLTIAYHTPGPYADEAARLRRSLDAVGMPHEIVEVPSAGDWNDNVALKAQVIRRARERHGGGLLYVDVDAFVHADCTPYFEALTHTADFAAHWFQGRGAGGVEQGNDKEHMLSGTLWFNDTPAARELLDEWIANNQYCVQRGDKTGQGQRNLAWAVAAAQLSPVRVHRLPGRYCYVFRRPECYPAEERNNVVIEHTLASRENRDHSAGTVDLVRRARLAELDAGPEPIEGAAPAPDPGVDLDAAIRATHVTTHKRNRIVRRPDHADNL